MEVGGINYLIPTDAKIAADRDIGFEAVPLDEVLNAAERAKKLRLVILDACRDNPFANQMKRTLTVASRSVPQGLASTLTVASRSVSQGLAAVEPEAGTLVVYAAKDGETALDGDGTNSPFASAFVKNLPTPGLEVRRLFDLVRDDVMEATGRKQKPFSYGSISGRQDFFFVVGNANLAGWRLDDLKALANGTMPSSEPHRIQTLAVKGDAAEDVGIPVAPHSRPENSDRFGQPSSSDQVAPVTQRVVLYDEDPSDPKGKQYVGSVIWRTEPVKATGTQKPDIAVRADIEIPDRKLKMTMSFRRNTDTFAARKPHRRTDLHSAAGIFRRRRRQRAGHPDEVQRAGGWHTARRCRGEGHRRLLPGRPLQRRFRSRAQPAASEGTLVVRRAAGLRQPAPRHHRVRKRRAGRARVQRRVRDVGRVSGGRQLSFALRGANLATNHPARIQAYA